MPTPAFEIRSRLPPRAPEILVVDANEFRTLDFAVHARVIAPNSPVPTTATRIFLVSPVTALNSLFVPPEAVRGSTEAAGGNA